MSLKTELIITKLCLFKSKTKLIFFQKTAQSSSRSYNKRQLTKKQERLNYEQYLNQNGFKNFNDLEYLLKRLLYYYELEDADKLVSNFKHQK